MSTDFEDFSEGVVIAGCVIESLPVNIVAQTIGNIAVDIASQSVGNIAVNIAASAITLQVNILSQTVDLNIKTSGGANIVIDQLTQSAYLENRRTVSNNGPTASWTSRTSAQRTGKFFPRGCRGFITTIEVYCRDAGSSGGTLTVEIYPYPEGGKVTQANITVPAGATAGWRAATFNEPWNYDGLLIAVYGSSADMNIGYDAETPVDCWESGDSGASWTTSSFRVFARANVSAQTIGDLPVCGFVNIKDIDSALNVPVTVTITNITTPAIYNVSMPARNTEYSQLLPDHTKKLSMRERSGVPFRLAWVTGKVGPKTDPYLTVPSQTPYVCQDADMVGKTVYFATAYTSKKMELEVWT